MHITEIRMRNYQELLKKFKEKEAQEGQVERGSLTRFGDFTGISPRYLSHINNERKNIGHETARLMEVAFRLPNGWMDIDHLGGAIPMDAAAREFGNLAMKLYLKNPEEARAVLMRYMADIVFDPKASQAQPKEKAKVRAK